MTVNGFQSQLSTYASGAALGVIAMIAVSAPHLRLVDLAPAHPAAQCSARVSADQAETLRAAAIDAQAKRDGLVHGGSAYAAAKLGPTSDAGLVEAERALTRARAAFTAACD